MNEQEQQQIRQAWEKTKIESELTLCDGCGQDINYCVCNVRVDNLPAIRNDNTTVNAYQR